MSLVIPFTFVGGAGNKARASEVNANFQAVAAKFSNGAGGISAADIASNAAILASQLTSVAGQRITAAQLEDDCVISRCLKDDATAGSPNAAISSANQIVDGIITNLKLAPATIAQDRLKVSYVETAFSFALGAFLAGTGLAQGDVNMGVLPVATYNVLHLFIRDSAVSGGGNSIYSQSPTISQSGGNWAFGTVCYGRMSQAGNFTGTLCGLFLQKV